MAPEPEPTIATRSLRAHTAGDKRVPSTRPAARSSTSAARPHHGLAVALPSLALLIPALIALARHFDGLYGQDPFAYYNYAIGPLRAALLAAALPPPFHWPPGYPFLVALTSFITGTNPLAGQLVSLLAGLLIPTFTALLAHEAWPGQQASTATINNARLITAADLTGAGRFRGRSTTSRFQPPSHPSQLSHLPIFPLLAGFLVACCGQLWQSSIVVMSDTTGLAAATAGTWALLRYGHRRHAAWLLAAAALLAYAILTRWAYALIALPCAVYGCWLLARAIPAERRRLVTHMCGALLIACAILGPTLYAALSAMRSTAAPYAAFAVDLQVYRWHPLFPFRSDFSTPDGRLTYTLPNGVYYATLFARPFYFTPLLAPLALLGLWRALRRPTAPLLLLVGWLGSILGFHAGAPWQNVRFVLACAPPFAILLALGLATLWGHANQRLTIVARALLVAGLAWMLVGGAQLLDNFIDRKEADLAVVRAVALPPEARLLTFGLTLTFQHYTPYDTRDLSTFDPTTLAALLADDHPTYLLLDTANIEHQWPDRAPGINYRWLRDNPGLVPLAHYTSYTLYAIHPTRQTLGTLHFSLSPPLTP